MQQLNPIDNAILANSKELEWDAIGAIMLQASEQKDSTSDKSESFTDSVKKFARFLDLSPASLWRNLTAYKHLIELSKTEGISSGSTDSDLKTIAKSASPASLELHAKIARVAPKKVADDLARRILAGDITQRELIAQWKSLRPALEGKTARGKGVEAPNVDQNYAVYNQLERESRLLRCLEHDTSWLGKSCSFLKIFPSVMLNLGSRRVRFAAIAVAQENDDALEDVHLISFVSEDQEPFMFAAAMHMTFIPYCNYFWVVIDMSQPGRQEFTVANSLGIGFLQLRDDHLQVLAMPKYYKPAHASKVFVELLKAEAQR